MPDYKEMYVSLFRETTKAIDILQAAQRISEEIYISGSTASNLRFFRQNGSGENLNDRQQENPYCGDKEHKD